MAYVLKAYSANEAGKLEGFYSGRAGALGSSASWVGAENEAFRYEGAGEAAHKAEVFNRHSRLHGLVFWVKEL